MNKTDVQIQLLKKLHEVCQKENIQYFLYGKSAVNIAFKGCIGNNFKTLNVAMTQSDAERFANAINSTCQNIYVDDKRSNPELCYYNSFMYMLNTFEEYLGECNPLDAMHRKHMCIHILIDYIEFDENQNLVNTNDDENDELDSLNNVSIDLLDDSEERKNVSFTLSKRKDWLRRVSSIDYQGKAFWKARVLSKIAKPLFADRYNRHIYEAHTKKYSFDKYEDAMNYPFVKIESKRFPTSLLSDLRLVELENGLSVYIVNDIEEYARYMYGKNWTKVLDQEEKKSNNCVFETPEELEKQRQIQEYVKEIKKLKQVILKSEIDSKELNEKTKKMRLLVEMTGDKVPFIEYYNEKKIEIEKMLLEDDMKGLNTIFKPLLVSQKKYVKKGLGYSLGKDLDSLFFEYLKRKKRLKMIEKIKKQSSIEEII